MVDGDEAGAWTIVENALTSTLDPQDVHLDLLAPALGRIGEDWEAGRLSVADEHRATVVAGRLIGRLGPRFARRGRKRGVVVVAAPSGETHALPGAMLSDLLRGAGFEVVDLGADTPTASIVEAAEHATRLVAVLIGVTSTGHDKTVRAAITAFRAAGIDVPAAPGRGSHRDQRARGTSRRRRVDRSRRRHRARDHRGGHRGRECRLSGQQRGTGSGACTNPMWPGGPSRRRGRVAISPGTAAPLVTVPGTRSIRRAPWWSGLPASPGCSRCSRLRARQRSS